METNENGTNNKNNNAFANVNGALSERATKWVSSSAGGLAGGILTILFIVLPVFERWLSNVKEVSLAQIKNTSEQIAYITQRQVDSEKERDLYRNEMNLARSQVEQLRDRLFSCEDRLRGGKK